jgi:hypothetical protein
MTFWRVTMRRSISLGKAYIIIGAIIAVYGTIISNVLTLIPSNPSNLANTSIDLANIFPILAVAFLPLSALLFSMPVIMLFVYDKNKGIFEYLLSTGLDQLDIFKGYVKTALFLAASLLTSSVILNTIIGIFLGTSLTFLASISILTFSIGISVVFLVTVSMIAFSSLQKTPTGANSPLGVTIGVIPVFPALILPFIFPSYVLVIDISIATVTLFVSIGLLLSIGKLILREKLLP